jgi:hypothetical protein
MVFADPSSLLAQMTEADQCPTAQAASFWCIARSKTNLPAVRAPLVGWLASPTRRQDKTTSPPDSDIVRRVRPAAAVDRREQSARGHTNHNFSSSLPQLAGVLTSPCMTPSTGRVVDGRRVEWVQRRGCRRSCRAGR